jgi:CBS domain-containing protein
MRLILVKELMVPLEEYATVSEDATLLQAIHTLEEVHARCGDRKYPHRAVLAKNAQGKIVGKLSHLDALSALEKPYREITQSRSMERFGFSAEYIRSIADEYEKWRKPMDDLFRRAGQIIVRDVMYTPARGEYVQEDTSMDEAIYHLVTGRHQSLLVTRGEDVVGVLRLTDVFDGICESIKRAEQKAKT